MQWSGKTIPLLKHPVNCIICRKMSGPPEYDPRRLFPFGLSPIPEVPSELASEVSSMYSYACDEDEESEADTEIEGTKTPGSIMYSGNNTRDRDINGATFETI